MHKHWTGFIEFKGEGTAVRPVQVVVLRNLRKRGKVAYLAREPGILYDPLDYREVGNFSCGAELLDLILQDLR